MTKKNQQEKNPAWKGQNAGYRAKHIWIQFHYGKANKCEFDETHQANYFHWSNISGEYIRDISDWQQLCPKCHKNYDMKNSKKQPITHCYKGHEYTDENTRLRKQPGKENHRICKECQKFYMKQFKQIRKEELTI
jgi:hypothetical protein